MTEAQLHKIKVTQVFRVTKTVVLEVAAEWPADAVEVYNEGGVTLPNTHDPLWRTTSTQLEDEWAEQA